MLAFNLKKSGLPSRRRQVLLYFGFWGGLTKSPGKMENTIIITPDVGSNLHFNTLNLKRMFLNCITMCLKNRAFSPHICLTLENWCGIYRPSLIYGA